MAAQVDRLDVRCPTCQASVGVPCPHEARAKEAREAEEYRLNVEVFPIDPFGAQGDGGPAKRGRR
jgi:hypothetical protein